MRIVFDIDDTISRTINRDYINAKPFQRVVDKINMLYDQGHEIILYTARGQKSCNGDLEKIKEKNEKILKEWLSKNNVHYTELLFGKPLGDLYVDDKCMEVREFLSSEFKSLTGGSNKQVYQFGRYVKKDLGSHEELLNFQEWYELKPEFIDTPHVISYLYNEVYLDYIEGSKLSDLQNIDDSLNLLIFDLFKFRTLKYDSFDLSYHLQKLDQHCLDKLIRPKIEFCKNMLKENEQTLIKNASFSHGDCTLENLIKCGSYSLYFLDPHMKKEASSYLFDLAKLRMSLDNYEYLFNHSHIQRNEKYLLDDVLKRHDIFNLCCIIEYMHILRLYKYKTIEERKIVHKMLENLEKEMKWKIN